MHNTVEIIVPFIIPQFCFSILTYRIYNEAQLNNILIKTHKRKREIVTEYQVNKLKKYQQSANGIKNNQEKKINSSKLSYKI